MENGFYAAKRRRTSWVSWAGAIFLFLWEDNSVLYSSHLPRIDNLPIPFDNRRSCWQMSQQKH